MTREIEGGIFGANLSGGAVIGIARFRAQGCAMVVIIIRVNRIFVGEAAHIPAGIVGEAGLVVGAVVVGCTGLSHIAPRVHTDGIPETALAVARIILGAAFVVIVNASCFVVQRIFTAIIWGTVIATAVAGPFTLSIHTDIACVVGYTILMSCTAIWADTLKINGAIIAGDVVLGATRKMSFVGVGIACLIVLIRTATYGLTDGGTVGACVALDSA